jgi:two-component system sensor histidine kinase RegB
MVRVSVTGRRGPSDFDLRPAGELAPSLALPWIARLRYGAMGGQAALILLAYFVFHVQLPLGWLAIPLAVTAASNLLLYRFAAWLGARPALGWLLTLDTVALTALLALSGGPANPFSLLYLVQIALSAVVLNKQWTWGLGCLSVAGFGFLFWMHVRVPVFEGHHPQEGFAAHLVGMWIAFIAAALLITIFIGKVSEALRHREQQVLSLRDELARHERLASIVTLAAGAAHELGTPLATIAIASRDLELGASDEAVAGEARLIRAEVDRCSGILRQMSAQGAESAGETPAPIALAELLEKVRRSFAPAEQRQIATSVPADARAVLPAEATRQALAALVRNALDATSGGQNVQLSAECAGGKLRFSVRDFGSGMPPETLKRVGEPFFSTKSAGRGMGLGSYLASAFAATLNGSLQLESEAGAGTLAVLEVPLELP